MFTQPERQLFATAFPDRTALRFHDIINPAPDSAPTGAQSSFEHSRMQVAQSEWRRIFANKTRPQAPAQEIAPIRLNQHNLRQNIPWGDALTNKDPNHTRYYGLNVNGFQLDREGGQFSDYCKVHAETQADVSGIQEHNIDTTQPQLRSILHATARKHWQRCVLTQASTPITFAGSYKPGGTLMLSTSSIVGRLSDHGTDKWGRWVYQTLKGRQGTLVTFITAYQVVDTHASQMGNLSAAAQQSSLLASTDDPIQRPRQAFIRDLIAFVTTLQRQQHDIVVAGDFNERLARRR